MNTMLAVILAVLTQAATASEQLAERVLAHPALAQRAAGHRLVAIRVAAGDVKGSQDAAEGTVSVVFFDHTALEARRVTYDPSANRILGNEPLPGRPQRSDRELADAIAIVRRDRALARLLEDGGVLDGGFVVDDPGGSRRRMLQLKLTRADRRILLRSIVVDLTRGEINSVRETHGR